MDTIILFLTSVTHFAISGRQVPFVATVNGKNNTCVFIACKLGCKKQWHHKFRPFLAKRLTIKLQCFGIN